MRIAVLQMTSGIHPGHNCDAVVQAAGAARAGGAAMLYTPEMSLLLDRDRGRADRHMVRAELDRYVAKLAHTARAHEVWIALGSMAYATAEGRRVNRSFLFPPDGGDPATYDKIHMFDVDLANGESWRESAAYVPGDRAVVVEHTPVGRLGLAICYDLRFPALFGALSERRCDVVAVPSAFTVPTGQAHWHVLLRARAIECSAYVVAAAQVGDHEDGRQTFGHSLVVDPWGDIILDMGGTEPGLGFADIDPGRIAEVRRQLPSLANRRTFTT